MSKEKQYSIHKQHLLKAKFVCPWNRIRGHLVFGVSIAFVFGNTLTLAIIFEP